MSERVVVVCISGKMHSGKTTTAQDIIFTLAGTTSRFHQLREVNLATPLKLMCADMLGFDFNLTQTAKGKRATIAKYDCSVGRLLQRYGEMHCAEFGEDIWAHKLVKLIQTYANLAYYEQRTSFPRHDKAKPILVLVADVRKPVEIEALRKHFGATIVRLEGDPQNMRAKSTRDQTHISEIALDDYTEFDMTCNTDTLSIAEVVASIINFAKLA